MLLMESISIIFDMWKLWKGKADDKLTKNIKNIILKNKEVFWVYDLVLHNYWPNSIIATAHIQVADNISAKELHKLSRKIQWAIHNEFWIILTLGIYATNNEWIFKEMQNFIKSLSKKYKNIIQIHWFYGDKETKEIPFDIVFDFNEKKPEQIVKEISNDLQSKYPEFLFNIVIDIDFSD